MVLEPNIEIELSEYLKWTKFVKKIIYTQFHGPVDFFQKYKNISVVEGINKFWLFRLSICLMWDKVLEKSWELNFGGYLFSKIKAMKIVKLDPLGERQGRWFLGPRILKTHNINSSFFLIISLYFLSEKWKLIKIGLLLGGDFGHFSNFVAQCNCILYCFHVI